ncbi:MAG: DUF2232 domain-containing protein [Christensenellaceae bacterium]
MENTKYNYKQVAICTAIAVGMVLLGAVTNGVLLVLFAPFIPMVLVVAGTGSSPSIAAICTILLGVLTWLVAGVNTAILLMVCALPIVIAMSYVIKKQLSFYMSVLISCITMLVVLGLFLLTVFLLYGADLTTLITNTAQDFLTKNPDIARTYYYVINTMQSGAQVLPDANAILSVPAQTAVDGTMRYVSIQMAMMLPQMATMGVALLGLLNFTIPRAITKKLGGAVGHAPAFCDLALPKSFGIWSIALLIVAFLGVQFEWRNFNLVYAIVMGFFSVIYTIQGMAFVDWLLKKKMESTGGRIAIIAVTFLALSFMGAFSFFLGQLYMWLGFFEQIARIRKREQIKP